MASNTQIPQILPSSKNETNHTATTDDTADTSNHTKHTKHSKQRKYSDDYWTKQLHPEIKSPPKIPITNFNSRWKSALFTFLCAIPGPPAAGVKKEVIEGIGVYYSPIAEETDETKDETHKKTPQSASPASQSASQSAPAAILWIHGGGRILGSAYGAKETQICCKIVKLFGVPVLCARYGLAPKHPFPKGLNDLMEAYRWLVGRVRQDYGDSKLNGEGSDGISGVRIAVAGESAGGGLAAELCQRLLDESQTHAVNDPPLPPLPPLPQPVAQLLVYPMLDDRTCTDPHLSSLPPHFIWNNASNAYGWSSYLGPNHQPGDPDLATLLPYASASRRENLKELPPAWIICGTLDLFRDECEEYARRLKEDGVAVEYVEVKGGHHGFMTGTGVSGKEEFVREAWDSFGEFGKRYLLE